MSLNDSRFCCPLRMGPVGVRLPVVVVEDPGELRLERFHLRLQVRQRRRRRIRDRCVEVPVELESVAAEARDEHPQRNELVLRHLDRGRPRLVRGVVFARVRVRDDDPQLGRGRCCQHDARERHRDASAGRNRDVDRARQRADRPGQADVRRGARVALHLRDLRRNVHGARGQGLQRRLDGGHHEIGAQHRRNPASEDERLRRRSRSDLRLHVDDVPAVDPVEHDERRAGRDHHVVEVLDGRQRAVGVVDLDLDALALGYRLAPGSSGDADPQLCVGRPGEGAERHRVRILLRALRHVGAKRCRGCRPHYDRCSDRGERCDGGSLSHDDDSGHVGLLQGWRRHMLTLPSNKGLTTIVCRGAADRGERESVHDTSEELPRC